MQTCKTCASLQRKSVFRQFSIYVSEPSKSWKNSRDFITPPASKWWTFWLERFWFRRFSRQKFFPHKCLDSFETFYLFSCSRWRLEEQFVYKKKRDEWTRPGKSKEDLCTDVLHPLWRLSRFIFGAFRGVFLKEYHLDPVDFFRPLIWDGKECWIPLNLESVS